ncbi:PQQ-binding-like beta-propeller repeat protein [Fimbriimonas ginsengisoli]|uniref:Serine/threonine protein kinase n=1 Tax=Fimbriimonas ginsengisoli Gsoil 348 TaxID=661478 RepID=A0A068NJ39_FIMGI|nr:PQQ-binding-like beta-propeller repeat protein [Fimbriimonas ginsengisoli]AIE83477.1 serine/threonine protein kinase [Fimbriimonas ginsengisoli Gsoil 348]
MISRRDLIRVGAAAALTPFARRAEALSQVDALSFSFAFFSDTHVGLKYNIAENRSMFAEMAALPLAFGINGGDVTDYGWVGEYANYREILKTAPFQVHHIPGNHDVRWSPLGPKAYREGTGDPMYKSFSHKGIHFALLDSTIPLSHYGHFESEMLRWLEADLKQAGREIPIFVATHHWVGREGIMVDNESELLRIIEPYNVKLILNAHGHSDLLWTWNGVPNTMNKGLYQLSWERLGIDRKQSQAHLSRRTKEHPEQKHLLSIPLDAPKEKRAIWPVQIDLKPADEIKDFRWDDTPWQPIALLSTAKLVGGTHNLAYRAGKDEYRYAGKVEAPASAKGMKPIWDRKLSGGVMSHLRLGRDVLYVSAMDGSLTALRSKDGEPLWTAHTGGYCHSSPLVLKNLIVVGSADGNVYAFDRNTGKPRWKTPTHGPVYASGAEAQGIVAIGSGDGTIYGLEAATGNIKWLYEIPKSETSFVQSPAATDGERFYFGAWDRRLYALDARTGEFRWSQACTEKTWPYSPAIGGPAVGGGRVYVPANGNILWSFYAETGEPVWSCNSPGDKFGYSSPCLVDDRIYIGCLGDKGEVRCVSSIGQILWTTAIGSTIYDSSPCHAAGVVTIGSVNGLVTSMSAEDGKVLGQYHLPTGHILASPVAEPGRVYAASLSDHVVAFDIKAT